jgi:PAS domain S-box-containing protein
VTASHALPERSPVAPADDVPSAGVGAAERRFALSPNLLCVTGAGGEFRHVNPAWERALGWPREALVGRRVLDFVHPDDRAATEAASRAPHAGGGADAFVSRFRGRDGSYRRLSWVASPPDERGRSYRVAMDVTELWEAEAQLAPPQNVEAVGQRAGAVAHDRDNILAAAADGAARRGGETVLLVDDEPAVRAGVARMLTRVGYTVLPASGGHEALRVADDHAGAIDLVLTDMVMPGMSGRAVAEALTARRPGLRVLFMSGYGADEALDEDGTPANRRFLEKPFTIVSLETALNDLMAV